MREGIEGELTVGADFVAAEWYYADGAVDGLVAVGECGAVRRGGMWHAYGRETAWDIASSVLRQLADCAVEAVRGRYVAAVVAAGGGWCHTHGPAVTFVVRCVRPPTVDVPEGGAPALAGAATVYIGVV